MCPDPRNDLFYCSFLRLEEVTKDIHWDVASYPKFQPGVTGSGDFQITPYDDIYEETIVCQTVVIEAKKLYQLHINKLKFISDWWHRRPLSESLQGVTKKNHR